MIRFGVIGTNWITERFIDAAKEFDDFSLTSVYSRTEEKAREFAHKTGASFTFTSIEEMAKSNEIDAVYIASPNSFHHDQAILCMKHGIHVLCEKPLASNAAEVENMIKTAQEQKVVFMEAMKATLLPTFLNIKENVHKLGTVRRYVGNYCQYSSRYDAFKEGTVLNAFNPKFSNGALMDLGVYCLYPLVVLFGQPKSVKAEATMLSSGVDGQGSIILTYEDMEAVITYSKITNSSLPSEIQGEEGNMVIDEIHTPKKAHIYYRNGEQEDISVEQNEKAMYAETKEFLTLIKEGRLESKVNSHKNSLITAKVLTDIRKQIGLVFPADQ
ncbi:Gfo/Idh/MocA family oxidoreductase [Priestia filamentosa]|uniref:Gfo/Idh/MocA family protein n=1 Tax=Priestia filamentosa TaxID=1402861 RepID=UPI003D2A24DC